MGKSLLLLVSLASVGLLATTARADSTPDWVKAALQSPVYNYEKNVSYVVLLDERVTTVRENGKAETRSRYVTRVLTQEGRAAARREIQYDSQMKISDLQAWHIRADNKVFELESERMVEEAFADDLYSNIRSKVMRFGEVDIGSVVAFEWVQKEKQFVNQDYHFFQTRAPVISSRYQLNLPANWKVEAHVFNYGSLKPLVRGNSYTWEVQNLPAIKEELWMPDVTGLSPYLAVSYYQSTGDRSKLAFSSWQDVSCWAEEMMDTKSGDEAVIERKAKELVADSKTDFDRVRAIAHWVQKNIRYVSIQLGVISGYKPNPADVVLKKGYGDCKDKSALMQSMLQAIGLQSHSVLVFSGDPTRVRPEFPSPLQFNHAVVAVEVGADSPAAMTHPKLGRLLFFDPTDSVTPLGDFPFYLQGSYGLVVKGSAGELIKLPTYAESVNNLKREIDVQVKDTGEVQATVKEVFTGQLASVARRGLAQSSLGSYERELAARVAREIPGALLGGLKINTDAEPFDPLIVEYTIKADSYGSRLGKLLVIKPLLLRAQNYPVFTTQERNYPILFDIQSVREDLTRIILPEGFRLDELPTDTRVRTDFGEFDLTYQVSGQSLVVRRRLAIKQQLMPAAQYSSVKKFFETAQAASQSSIVLVN